MVASRNRVAVEGLRQCVAKNFYGSVLRRMFSKCAAVVCVFVFCVMAQSDRFSVELWNFKMADELVASGVVRTRVEYFGYIDCNTAYSCV